VIVPAIDFGQFFLRHIEGPTINFGNLLELDNGIAETTFANQPTWRFDDVSVQEMEIEMEMEVNVNVKMKIQIRFGIGLTMAKVN